MNLLSACRHSSRGLQVSRLRISAFIAAPQGRGVPVHDSKPRSHEPLQQLNLEDTLKSLMQYGSQDLKSENLMLLHDEPFTGTVPGVKLLRTLGRRALRFEGVAVNGGGGRQHPHTAQMSKKLKAGNPKSYFMWSSACGLRFIVLGPSPACKTSDLNYHVCFKTGSKAVERP